MVSKQLQHEITNKINTKTKPVGSLGRLEQIAYQVAAYQGTLEPVLLHPSIIVFAGDHGIASQNVSAYPQEVTFQMVLNFIQGGAAINVFTKQHGIELVVVDTGVIGQFDAASGVVDCKVAQGCADFSEQPAMTQQQYLQCFSQAQKLIAAQAEKGCNVIGFGDMGIGNTAAASMIMHNVTGLPLEQCVGHGTGLNDTQYQHKLAVLKKAHKHHGNLTQPIDILQTYAGFEIVHLTAAMLAAYERGMLILVDGFIATSAFVAAQALNPAIFSAAIFCHQSNEKGHEYLLAYLNAKPLLTLDMRVGEGTGCAVAYPLIDSALRFFNDMASFESANVSQKHT